MSLYPQLDPLYDCEICLQKIFMEEPVILFLDRNQPKNCVYAHQSCVQVNCDRCGQKIPRILEQLFHYSALGFFPPEGESGPTCFRHLTCEPNKDYYLNQLRKLIHKN